MAQIIAPRIICCETPNTICPKLPAHRILLDLIITWVTSSDSTNHHHTQWPSLWASFRFNLMTWRLRNRILFTPRFMKIRQTFLG